MIIRRFDHSTILYTIRHLHHSTIRQPHQFDFSTPLPHGSSVIRQLDYSPIRRFDKSTIRPSDNSTVWYLRHSTIQLFTDSTTLPFGYSTTRHLPTTRAFDDSITRTFYHSPLPPFDHSTIRQFDNSIIRPFGDSKPYGYSTRHSTIRRQSTFWRNYMDSPHLSNFRQLLGKLYPWPTTRDFARRLYSTGG